MNSKINPNMSLMDFAAAISEILTLEGISAVLTGGAAVSIYTNNFYESGDADFISSSDQDVITVALARHGFTPITKNNKNFKHPNCEFTLEFPGREVYLLGERQTKVDMLTINGTTLQILSPTQSVMDRLSAYIAWKDVQGLDQAQWIAERQPVTLSRIVKWAKVEGASVEQLGRIKRTLKVAIAKFNKS